MMIADTGSPDRPGRRSATDIPALVASSPIVVGAAPGRRFPPCEVSSDRPTPVASPIASWALRQPSGDIDAEVLRWIASHVKGKKRLGLA